MRTTRYYEGWYYKIVSDDGSLRYAFIPGVSLDTDAHAFVQVIDGSTGQTSYFRFPPEAFSYSRRHFEVRIAGNIFSGEGFSVDLKDDEHHIRGQIGFSESSRYPVSLFWPGIMGWYRFVPFMQTYHGVVSLDHRLKGVLVHQQDTLSFDNGRGYIEKDWGSSMPKAWIWMQSNSFMNHDKASFMLSVAHVPWITGSFTGFLGYLLFNDEILRFATYTSAKIVEIHGDPDQIQIVIEDRGFRLTIRGLKGVRGELMAPLAGQMNRMIHESLDAILFVCLEDPQGNVLFEGQTKQAGLELVGDQQLLKP
ncbi:MAG: tocopherol cyclase family protein [Bacteroidales bacterium]